MRIKPEHSLLEDFIASRNSLSIRGRLGSDSGNVIVYRKERNESVPSFEVLLIAGPFPTIPDLLARIESE